MIVMDTRGGNVGPAAQSARRPRLALAVEPGFHGVLFWRPLPGGCS